MISESSRRLEVHWVARLLFTTISVGFELLKAIIKTPFYEETATIESASRLALFFGMGFLRQAESAGLNWVGNLAIGTIGADGLTTPSFPGSVNRSPRGLEMPGAHSTVASDIQAVTITRENGARVLLEQELLSELQIAQRSSEICQVNLW